MSQQGNKKKKIYIKRITADINEIISEPVDNIHIWYDENNITEVKALIIGPENTPYENGFYFFSLTFPETYPFDSPSAKFETINNIIRFNPNLYENGKVCLSILGTWTGPKWSSIQTLKSTLLSIQSLLNDNPIQNEPGWENKNDNDVESINYKEYIRYNNYYYAMLHMLQDENFFPYFNDILKQYFLDNYEVIISNIQKLTKLDNKKVHTPIWNKEVTINYSGIIDDFNNLYNKLSQK